MYDEILKEENKVIVKNIAPFDVERAGINFEAGKERFIYFSQKLNPEIKACSHLVVITNRHKLYKQIGEKISIIDEYLEHLKVSIIILVMDELDYIKKCLESLKKYTDNYELIIIDNGSKQKTKKYLDSIDWLDFILITNKENKGIPYAWNQGIKIAKNNYICFLNSDTVVTPNWLYKLMKGFKEKKDCGIVGPTTSHCGGPQCDRILMNSRFEMTPKQINKFASDLKEGYIQREVMGFCFIVKKKVFKKVGVFDYKKFKLGNTEEREFIWRAEKLGNYKPYWVKGAYVHHYGHQTFNTLKIDPYAYNKKVRIEWEKNKKFIEPKFIENDVKLGRVKKNKIDIYKSKKVIITANIGNYDNLIEQHYSNPGYSFILFTDNKNLKSALWKIIHIKPKLKDPRRESREYKWLIHRFFPEAKYSLWIDSNVLIKTDINTLIEKYLNKADIAMHIHGRRNCIYKEAEVCIKQKLDYADNIKKQVEKYKLEGYPENNGLHEGTVILRRHTKEIEKFNEAVWAGINNGSTRDQLTLDYIAWKQGVKINPLPGHLINPNSKDLQFGKVRHKTGRRQYGVKINVIYPNDNWILQKIGEELLKIESEDIKIIRSQKQNLNYDINYYINWAWWKILNPKLDKSRFDIVFFTHFDDESIKYLDTLNKTDMIICESSHGEQELIKRKIKRKKIRVCPYWGVSTNIKKKIVIGTSGREYKRKNKAELEKLKRDLDKNIFEFEHSNWADNKFFSKINYYLQTSIAEGGSMDILNAIYSRIPIISRNIGFIYNMVSSNDFIYKNYEELLNYLQNIGKGFKEKDSYIKNYTWDNFRDWHIKLFKELKYAA